MATKVKTITDLENEIFETFRKWWLDQPHITYGLPRKSLSKRVQTKDERTVKIEYRVRRRHSYVPVHLVVSRGDRAIDNLQLIAKAVEHLRMADVREITDLLVQLLRQTDPVAHQAPPPPPPPKGAGQIPAHYKLLGVLPDADMLIIEAAYKALVKRHHPDAGGKLETMQQINAAMDKIRKERGN